MTNENNSGFLAKSIERATCKFIHVPGPNPILTPGSAGSWDDGVIEACDIFKDHDTYYLYYHGTSKRTAYQIGVATASGHHHAIYGAVVLLDTRIPDDMGMSQVKVVNAPDCPLPHENCSAVPKAANENLRIAHELTESKSITKERSTRSRTDRV